MGRIVAARRPVQKAVGIELRRIDLDASLAKRHAVQPFDGVESRRAPGVHPVAGRRIVAVEAKDERRRHEGIEDRRTLRNRCIVIVLERTIRPRVFDGYVTHGTSLAQSPINTTRPLSDSPGCASRSIMMSPSMTMGKTWNRSELIHARSRC